MRTSSFQIDRYVWHVNIENDGQVLFSLEVPYEYLDPIWHDWDDHGVAVTTTTEEFTISVHPVSIIRMMVNTLVSLVSTYQVDAFYFEANSSKKNKLYRSLISKHLKNLPGIWEVQGIDQWFFLRKISGQN